MQTNGTISLSTYYLFYYDKIRQIEPRSHSTVEFIGRTNQLQIRLELNKRLLDRETESLQRISALLDVEQDEEKKHLKIQGDYNRQMIERLLKDCQSCQAELASL